MFILLHTLVCDPPQELESLTAPSAPPSAEAQPAASVAARSDKEPISDFIKETNQHLDGVGNSIAAFRAQLEAFNKVDRDAMLCLLEQIGRDPGLGDAIYSLAERARLVRCSKADQGGWEGRYGPKV